MPLHNIKEEAFFDDLVDNDQTFARKVLTVIIKNINVYYEDGGLNPKLFVGVLMLEYIYDDQSYVFSPIGGYDNGEERYIQIGQVAGIGVHIAPCLDDYSYFLGTRKELESILRKDKINKILDRC